MPNPNPITNTAAAIAAQLSKTERILQQTIWRCVHVLGAERTQAFVGLGQNSDHESQSGRAGLLDPCLAYR